MSRRARNVRSGCPALGAEHRDRSALSPTRLPRAWGGAVTRELVVVSPGGCRGRRCCQATDAPAAPCEEGGPGDEVEEDEEPPGDGDLKLAGIGFPDDGGAEPWLARRGDG